MNIGFVSLGCPKNLVDSENMLGIIEQYKMHITNNPAKADVIIVNTCGFIQAAKEESINTILQMAEYKKTGRCKYLIVTGCLVQRYAADLFHEMPEIDALVGTAAFTDIGMVLEKVLTGMRILHLEKSPVAAAPVASEPAKKGKSEPILEPRKLTTPKYMAYLKIAEGCDNRCSYCAIPFIRGPYISRPYEEIIAEAKNLVAQGVEELILIAQDTSRYGIDLYGSYKLPALLKDLNDIRGLKWIRVLYLYPHSFTDKLINAFATLPKVCKYVDIPLQHASDRLLGAMHRYDKRADVEKLLHKLRKRVPGIVIRTTFIVGFPGETEEDFAKLKDFVTKERFENAGVFTYSQEENTEAATMSDQIPEEIKKARYDELMSLQAGISEAIHVGLEGKTLKVIVEGFAKGKKNVAMARSYREAPDIDGNIYIENAGSLEPGDMVTVKVKQGFTYDILTEIHGKPEHNAKVAKKATKVSKAKATKKIAKTSKAKTAKKATKTPKAKVAKKTTKTSKAKVTKKAPKAKAKRSKK
jgi:ribosomal protein S12 methylthiotransferase